MGALIALGLGQNHTLLEDHFGEVRVDEQPVAFVSKVREGRVDTNDEIGHRRFPVIGAVN
jgi:hypothetical protein